MCLGGKPGHMGWRAQELMEEMISQENMDSASSGTITETCTILCKEFNTIQGNTYK